MAELKTRKTKDSVPAFLAKIADPQARRDCKPLVGLMEAAAGAKDRVGGTGLVGFGVYRYKTPATGRACDWFQIGFSPRKAALTLYLTGGVHKHGDLLKKRGKHKTSMSCLYIRTLEDVDAGVLKKLIDAAVRAKKMGEV